MKLFIIYLVDLNRITFVTFHTKYLTKSWNTMDLGYLIHENGQHLVWF